jgi:hypothetical protein
LALIQMLTRSSLLLRISIKSTSSRATKQQQIYSITNQVNYSNQETNLQHPQSPLLSCTTPALFGTLAVEAEAINEDEEDEENQHQKETKVLVTPFVELGRFHTKKINGIKELGESTQVVTISDD